MISHKAIRVRIEANPAQRKALGRYAGARRFTYNWALQRRREHYEQTGKTITKKQLSAELTALKHQPETEWLREIESQLLQQALIDLRRSYKNFFERRANYPRFKSRKRELGSFRIPQSVSIKGRRLYVPRIGHVRLSEAVDLSGLTPKSATFKETATGHWFVSLVVQFELPDTALPAPVDETTVGIDMGLKELLVLSNGELVDNPRWYRAQERKLARAQRALSRKKKGSNNRVKARVKVALVHEQTRNRRQDFIHKTTTRLVKEHDTIVIEDLSLKGMARTKLSKSVMDAALGEFRHQLEYKALWSRKNLLVIDRWFPSTQMCGHCRQLNKELTLNDRKWTCTGCGTDHDRDCNAANNIKTEGLRMHAQELVEQKLEQQKLEQELAEQKEQEQKKVVAVGHTETLNACGGYIRRLIGRNSRKPVQSVTAGNKNPTTSVVGVSGTPAVAALNEDHVAGADAFFSR